MDMQNPLTFNKQAISVCSSVAILLKSELFEMSKQCSFSSIDDVYEDDVNYANNTQLMNKLLVHFPDVVSFGYI